ncbi:MAG TPA: NUDIX domain-containing protein [Asticcacaulis sp.]|nr:NUDIX domain-containing protein [Asticcacaulis sp.]
MGSFTVLIGRFAPFCSVCLEPIRDAIAKGRQVVIVITDADLAISSRLPWTADEREAMARGALAEFGDAVHFVQIDARPRQDWDFDVLTRIGWQGQQVELTPGQFLGIEGASVHYVPEFASEEATVLAALYDGDDERLATFVPVAILLQVKSLRDSESFSDLAEEHRYFEAYKTAWKAAPYPVVLVSVDAVIVHSGHLLLVERGRIPGKGLWALPGGFVEPDEWLVASALRELREETGLQLADHEAQARLKSSHVFDDPWRSGRGRVITHAYHFELDSDDQPEVSGQDDAAAARWVPLDEVKAMRGRFFDDHGRIISHFLGI